MINKITPSEIEYRDGLHRYTKEVGERKIIYISRIKELLTQ